LDARIDPLNGERYPSFIYFPTSEESGETASLGFLPPRPSSFRMLKSFYDSNLTFYVTELRATEAKRLGPPAVIVKSTFVTIVARRINKWTGEFSPRLSARVDEAYRERGIGVARVNASYAFCHGNEANRQITQRNIRDAI